MKSKVKLDVPTIMFDSRIHESVASAPGSIQMTENSKSKVNILTHLLGVKVTERSVLENHKIAGKAEFMRCFSEYSGYS